jgi:hypothetical protein
MKLKQWSDLPGGKGLLLNSTLSIGFAGDCPILPW